MIMQNKGPGRPRFVAGFDKPFGVLHKLIFVGTSDNLQNFIVGATGLATL